MFFSPLFIKKKKVRRRFTQNDYDGRVEFSVDKLSGSGEGNNRFQNHNRTLLLLDL